MLKITKQKTSAEQKCFTIYKSRRSPTCVVPLLCLVRRGEKRQPQQTFLIDLTTHSQRSEFSKISMTHIMPASYG
ncbi:hypothetical protein CFP56_008729 [Quercus suber]|uniref:Uncharacterized protein n=1 Tax=Quercus suber TaxID=58331 RepID=A0AAW0M8C8_QUESU|nr:hypothetical protein CFP56_08739 [Quercus suber]